jgi:ribosomal protein S18 acetylase RimI-like enzyme
MTASYSIRKATEADCETLYEIGLKTPELKVSAEDVFMDKKEFFWEITREDGVCFVAEVNDSIAGFVLGSISTDPSTTKGATIVYIAVLPEFQNNGIGKALLAACEDAFRTHGVVEVHSWANTHSPVVGLFARHGYAKGHEYMWMDKKLF